MDNSVKTQEQLQAEFAQSEIVMRNMTQQEIKTLEDALARRIVALRRLSEIAPKLHTALEGIGLGIIHIGQTQCTARPLGGKFRFLKFRGYTARGDGRNSQQLRDKARKLSDVLSEATGVPCYVNMFSLEVIDAGETKSVLIELRPEETLEDYKRQFCCS